MKICKIHILGLLLFSCALCQAQKLSIKPYFSYHQSVLSQNDPTFYISRIYSSDIFGENFTLANGLEWGASIDYTLPDNLGFELGVGYFTGIKNSFESSPIDVDWNYHSIAVRPLISYAVSKGKSTFMAKIGPVIHASMSGLTISMFDHIPVSGFSSEGKKDQFSTYTFDNQLSFGYLTGLEYNYQLSGRFNLAMELGFEQYKYTPRKATVKYSYTTDEITYVNQIVGEPLYVHPTYLFQNKRLKESILFNSIYFRIGIKYNLWEK